MTGPILVTGGSGFIGGYLVERLRQEGRAVVNLDLVPPKNPQQVPFWVEGDIKDAARTRAVLQEHAPAALIHLAAQASLEGRTLADFPDNIAGTASVLAAIAATPSIRRVIITSTQYVVKPGKQPAHDEDYDPYTPYGASKVETERLTRASDLPCTWTIVRPTNVWGPLHTGFPDGLWKFIAKRMYVHPGYRPIIKSYAFVENVAFWLARLLEAPEAKIDRKTFYLADGTMDSRIWLNGFARAFTGRDVITVPHAAWALAGRFGDVLEKAGKSFPMTSERLFRMTTGDVISGGPAIELLGPGPIDFKTAMRRTTDWYKATHPVMQAGRQHPAAPSSAS